jgi:hypothetical protein
MVNLDSISLDDSCAAGIDGSGGFLSPIGFKDDGRVRGEVGSSMARTTIEPIARLRSRPTDALRFEGPN